MDADISISQRNNANATASLTAHSAAAQAFLASQRSQQNLSAAAAATALRSMTTTPTNVAQTQTRRTLQRQASNSSTGSGGRGRGTGPLQRQGSSGSMTERTFRTPSPHRPGSRQGQTQAPPVPKVPQDYNDIPPLPTKSHRRAVSLEPPPPRVQSPPLRRPAGRGQSLDRSAAPPAKAAPARPPQLQKIYELERSDSRDSINFSYPRNARPNSPPARSPVTTRSEERQFPKSMRNGASAAAAEGIRYDLSRTAEQPVKKKKKAVVKSEGSHFQSAASAGRPTVRSPEPGPEPEARFASPPPQPVKKKKKAAAATGETSHFRPESPAENYGSESDSTPEKATDRRSQRASGTLVKQPSIVREDWEGEQTGQPTAAELARQQLEGEMSPVGSPVNSPQSKKTSTGANVSRKIEEAPSAPKPVTSAVHDAVTLPQTNKHLSVANDEAPVTRTASLSPSRSTRFSDRLSSDLALGRKHDPLPRSISPAKSAMKNYSPSPNAGSLVDGDFPARARGSSQTPSEASEMDSLISADGYGSGMKKKKSAHVSFDPEPEVVGAAAPTPESDSPIIVTPPNKDTSKKGWFGFGKTRSSPLGTIPAEDDMEEFMAPRPALPSFGSVRGKGRNVEPAPAPLRSSGQMPSAHNTVTRSPVAPNLSSESSTTSSSTLNNQTLDTSVSSDHAIGALLAKEVAQKRMQEPVQARASGLPLPPEVTSVEGTGYASDSESSIDHPDEATGWGTEQVSQARVEPVSPAPSKPFEVAAEPQSDNVPTISVHPATPGLEQNESRDQYSVRVPGGFPASTSNLPSPDLSATNLTSTSPAGLGLAEPAVAESASAVGPPQPPAHALSHALLQQSQPATEKDSDNDSIYSDAAESQAELDGDGFGSINAIVDSPVVPESSFRSGDAPESPLATTSRGQGRAEPGDQTASWDNAQAHWSGLAQSYRHGVQPEPAPQEDVVPPTKPKTKKSKAPDTVAVAVAARPARQAYLDSVTPPPPSHQRETRQPKALAPAPVLRESTNVQSSPPKTRATLQKKHIPPGAVPRGNMSPEAPRSKPRQRAFSNDSDSESSFRRRRRGNSGGEASYSMRRSMRGGQAEAPRTVTAAPVSTMRPQSRDSRPQSPVLDQKPMRMSMRNSATTAGPTLRGNAGPTLRSQPEPPRSSSFFGKSKVKARSPARSGGAKPMGSRFKSRFVDSDDEDTPGPKTYRSRFQDSSDEEAEPAKLRPVRGIPRKTNEADSTDLEDSSDEEVTRATPAALPTLDARPTENDVKSGPQSPVSPYSEKKRRSLFGRFKSKKPKEGDASSKLGGTIAERNAILDRTRPHLDVARDPEYLSSPKKKAMENPNRGSRLGFSSVAERDAMIERTRAKLEEAKESQDQFPSTGSPTVNGRLSQRAKPQRIMSDSWPLPPKMPAAEDDRPHTADAADLTTASETDLRPGLGTRDNTSSTLRSQGGTVVYGRSGRKKKFPMLRKAFGLKD